MDITTLIVGTIVGAASVAFYAFRQYRQQEGFSRQREEAARRIAHDAETELAGFIKEVEVRHKAERISIQEELAAQFTERHQELERQKGRYDKREEQIDRKFDQLDRREQEQNQRWSEIEQERLELEKTRIQTRETLQQAQKRLESIAGLTTEEAKDHLMASLENEGRRESARLFKQLEEETKESATRKAQEAIATAIQRQAGEFVAERTVSVVTLPSEDMKGRIIGREGRNIRALEAATGCDLIIDDTPEAVVVSGFNPVRRQIAKRALEELIADGRIHPARIEGVVKKVAKSMEAEILDAGKQAVFDVGLHNIHPEILKLLGTLKFRTSYTQNVLAHSVEVAHFAGIIADELGLDPSLARRCGLLHDIGKAVDHDVQGSHAVIGGQFAKKCHEHPLVTNSIWSHHFEIEPTSIYGPLTNAADALSAARPGARREDMQTYIKRLEDLEGIATDFEGVDKVFAIQAGRELRVIVEYDRLNDEGAMMLARQIADRVENEMTYPGQIKVIVIREMRATEIAH